MPSEISLKKWKETRTDVCNVCFRNYRAGSVFLYTGQEKFQESQVTVLSYVLKQADTVVQNLRNVFNYLMGAKKIGEGQAYFSADLQAQISDMQRNINDLADNLRNVTGKSSGDIRKYVAPL